MKSIQFPSRWPSSVPLMLVLALGALLFLGGRHPAFAQAATPWPDHVKTIFYGKTFKQFYSEDRNVPGVLIEVRKADGSRRILLLGNCDWQGGGDEEGPRWAIDDDEIVVRYAIVVPNLLHGPTMSAASRRHLGRLRRDLHSRAQAGGPR